MEIAFDFTTLRIVMTVVSVIVFVGLVAWTFSKRRNAAYDEAANLPLNED
jgi:cytochrome c oxidase cbb3-type subunit 4